MFSKISALILFFAFFIGASFQHKKLPKSSLEKRYIKGKVLSIKTSIFSIEKNGETLAKGDPIWKRSYYNIFDKRGMEIEHRLYQEDGTEGMKQTWVYDEKRNLTQREEYAENGTLKNKEFFKYKYDKEGNITKRVTLNKNLDLRGIWFYKYPSLRNEMIIKKHLSSGRQIEIQTSKFDEYGNEIEVIKENFWNHPPEVNKITYSYDQNGNQIESRKYKRGAPDSLSQIKKSQYDAHNRLLGWTYYNSDGSFRAKVFNEYDEHGNRTAYIMYNSVNTPYSSITYEYQQLDSLGNWLSRIQYANDIAAMIEEREIIYY